MTAADEGYLLAYRWAQALAGGAALPSTTVPLRLGPGEVAHLRLEPVGLSAHVGGTGEYRRSFLLLGGPVGLALTGAASLARNAAKKAEAERDAIPRWRDLGGADVVLTSQRLAVTTGGGTASLWHAECAPMRAVAPEAGVPGVELDAQGMPPLRLRSPYAPLLYVLVHQLLDGRPPGLALPEGLLERARAAGR